MPNITNNSDGARTLPLLNGTSVEIAARGGTAEIGEKDWAAIKDRKSVLADITAGVLHVEKKAKAPATPPA